MIPSFVSSLSELMRKDKKIVIITADMGFSVFEQTQKEFGERFINTGVTEQASIGVATGLALSGHTVFFYAQSAFATMRCFEQVRLDVAYNHVNVKIVGTAAGFSLNQLGVSHFATEDVALMRLLPGMTVFTPGDPYEVSWAVKAAYQIEGPTYMRLSRNGSTVFHKKPLTLDVGKGIRLRKGADCTIFVSGGLLYLAQEVADKLTTQGVSMSIISMPTMKPLDTHLILHEAKTKKAIFTLEEHGIYGGIGTAVAEVLAQSGISVPFHKFAIPDTFTGITGTIPYILSENGLDIKKMTSKIRLMLKG